MKLHKALLPVVLSLIVLGAGCSFTQTVSRSNNNANVNAVSNINAASSVTYSGKDGQSALDLLQADHEVDVSDQGFVNAIDGVKPGDRQFWAFYINGEQAQVGAKDYITKNDEQIEWRLESF